MYCNNRHDVYVSSRVSHSQSLVFICNLPIYLGSRNPQVSSHGGGQSERLAETRIYEFDDQARPLPPFDRGSKSPWLPRYPELSQWLLQEAQKKLVGVPYYKRMESKKTRFLSRQRKVTGRWYSASSLGGLHFFPRKSVRFFSINANVGSGCGSTHDDDFVTFFNVLQMWRRYKARSY